MNLLGKATDTEFWKNVAEKECFKQYREYMLSLWQQNCENGPILDLRYSDFKIYGITGSRVEYENTYFARRRALLASAALSMIYPDEEKYITRLMDQVYSICDEYTWCLPAHQGNLTVNNNVNIDLFAAETGFALSEVYNMVGDRLEPLIKNRIAAEVERRIIAPFLSKTYNWEKATHNWNAVCSGSIGCTFMLMRPDLFDKILSRISDNLTYYLSGFENDGMCLEGCHYWHYGFGFFTVYADMVKTYTGGKLDYFCLDKVKSVATFIQKAFISQKAIISFSDGSRFHEYHIGLVHYLKGHYPDTVIAYHPKYSYISSKCARFCLGIRAATWLNEEYYNNPTPDGESVEYYACDSQMFIKRTSNYGFAAKGAHNAEPHNHNDVGNFIFAKNGKQQIVDFGPGVYCKQYFNKDTRYSFLEASSRGHNVPIIGGQYQQFGKKFAANGTRIENGEFVTDIAGAYGISELSSLERRFSFTERAVTLTDTFDYSGNGAITERLITLSKPTILYPGCVKTEDTHIYYDPSLYSCALRSEKREFNDEYFYFIDLTLAPNVNKFTCTIE